MVKNDTSDEGFNTLLEAYGDESGGYSVSDVDVKYRNEANTAPSMDSQKSESRRAGNTGRSFKNSKSIEKAHKSAIRAEKLC